MAAVERVFSGVNPQSLITLGEARGVLLLALAEAGVPDRRGDSGRDQARRHRDRRRPRRSRCAGWSTALLGRRLALDAADAAAAALAHGFVAARRGARPRPPRRAPPAAASELESGGPSG